MATRQLPRKKIIPRLGLEFGLGLVLGLGAIFIWGNCPRTVSFVKITVKTVKKKKKHKVKKKKKQQKEAGANFVSLCHSRNMVGPLKKT